MALQPGQLPKNRLSIVRVFMHGISYRLVVCDCISIDMSYHMLYFVRVYLRDSCIYDSFCYFDLSLSKGRSATIPFV